MTTYYVTSEEVLGSNYTTTSIECSTYNPVIDSTTTTVTVTVKDVYGDAVSGKEVIVTCSGGTFTALNGTSITAATTVTGTTNPSGSFTLSYTAGDWGNISISAGNVSKQLYVTGWREVSVTGATSYATLYVNGVERLAYFKYYRSSYNFSSTSDVTLHTGAIPSDYRPTVTGGVPCATFNPNVGLVVSTNGNISAVSIETGSKTINATGMWKY